MKAQPDTEVAEKLSEWGLDVISEKRHIQPRDALKGGRVENRVVRVQLDDYPKGSYLRYVDFTSLYPDRMLQTEYVFGHPQIRTKNISKAKGAYNSLIKGGLLAPQNLEVAVLPVHITMKDGGGTKLLFPLCRTCAEEQNFVVNSCCHNEPQCVLYGTWTTIEWNDALEAGYTVYGEIEEVWDWHKSGKGLYKEFVNTFFKIKTEASGYPNWVVTEEDKDKYIDQFYEQHEILLDKTKIVKNPGLKETAKSILNSLWGSWATNINSSSQTVWMATGVDFHDFINDDTKKDKTLIFVDDKLALGRCTVKEEFKKDSARGSIVHAAMTTASARHKLLKDSAVAWGGAGGPRAPPIIWQTPKNIH